MSVINIGGKAAIKLIFPKDFITSSILPLSGDYATVNSIANFLLLGVDIGLDFKTLEGAMDIIKASGKEESKYSSAALMFTMGYLQAKANAGAYVPCTIPDDHNCMNGFIALTDPKYRIEQKHERPDLRLVPTERSDVREVAPNG